MTYLLSSTVGEADIGLNYLSRVVRKPAFGGICENKDADQLRGNREADQRLCFRYSDSTIPLLSKSMISSWFVSNLVENPEDRFSQNEAHLNLNVNITDSVTIKL